jgi:prepilin-type N-terminal cleavage/methylation domain-containing protein
MADGHSDATRHAGPPRVAHALLSRWGHFAMSRSRTPGFTLVEMAVVILIFGMLFAFSIPAYQRINGSYQLKGATENLAAQLRMARSKAMSTGMDQPMHFTPNFMNSDYHIHYNSGSIPAMWKFPRGITYWSIGINPVLVRDGRVTDAAGNPASGLVILQDTRGNRDTVSVLASGLVLVK